jgi:ribosomal protein L2
MPSGELRKVLINCYATVGVASNSDHNLESMLVKQVETAGKVFVQEP